MNKNLVWVNTFNGALTKPAAVVVWPYRNRVSLNVSYGCPLGCAYCISLADGFSCDTKNGPVRLAEVDTILDTLDTIGSQVLEFRLSIGDFADPFLPEIRQETLALIAGLSARGYIQPIALTSKIAPPDELLQEMAKFHLPLTIYVSLGDVNNRVELPAAERITLARRAHAAGLHVVLLLRPLHPSYCVPQKFKPVLKKFRGVIDEVVLSGLRAPYAVRQSLAKKGIMIPEPEDSNSFLPSMDPNFMAAMLAVVASSLPGVVVSPTRACPNNRKFNLPCFTSSTQKYPMPAHARLGFGYDGHSVLRRNDGNGYCRLVIADRPKNGLSNEQMQALETLALIFDATPAINSWKLIGGAARVLAGQRESCHDLDIRVELSAFDEVVRRLADRSHGLQVKNCRAVCSRCTDCPDKEFIQCKLLMRNRQFAVAMISGVQVDITPALFESGMTTKIIPFGSYVISVEVEQEAA